jgi:hypothetical protein
MAVLAGLAAHAMTWSYRCSAAAREEAANEAAEELVFALRYAVELNDSGLQAPPDPVAFERCIRLDSDHWLACARAELGARAEAGAQ